MMAMPRKYLLDKFKVCLSLHEAKATRECALEVFQEQRMINDGFFEALLREVVLDSSILLRAYSLLQRFLYEDDKCEDWNIDMLRCIPNISFVLIRFLLDISQRENFWPHEKMIIDKLVLLVFQLESCSSDSTFMRATAPASELMRGDTNITKKVSWIFSDP